MSKLAHAGGQQHRVAGRCGARSRGHRVLHRGRSLRAHERRRAPARRPPHPCRSERRARTLPLNAVASGAKSCPFDRPPRDDHQRPRHTVDRGERGAYVGSLGIVHITHAPKSAIQAARCGSPGRFRAPPAWRRGQTGGIAQCQRGQGIGGVVQTGDLHAYRLEHRRAMAAFWWSCPSC